jgi:hypothetical protein
MKKSLRPYVISIICFFLFTSFSLAQGKILPQKSKVEARSNKILTNPTESVMDINNITCWTGEDGYHDWIVGGTWNGAYPNGNFIGSIFSEGIVWGGLVNDGTSPLVRVNGNTYGSGCLPVTRLYRVRPDYLAGNLTNDASNFFNEPVGEVTSSQIQELRDQYQADWNEWPADEGAPFKDVDLNGQYDPAVDIPGIPGAGQTLFIKYNDDQVPLYGSAQIGLNISETYWAYPVSGPLGNIIFKKVDINYCGTDATPPASFIDNMYLCQWADPDVGNSLDDFAGCDTTLNLGFAYNSTAIDAIYSNIGLAPPAAGYVFLQGVSEYTGNVVDSSIINFKWQHGYRFVNEKPMNSFIYFGSGVDWSDPAFTYIGTLEFYNLMRGFLPDPPYPASNEFPSDVADYGSHGVYLLAGDPVAGTGKIDGTHDSAGDRRISSVNGPFHLNLGETAEVVIALSAGMGNSNLNSITKLRENVIAADTSFLELVESGQVQVVDVKSISSENQNPEKFYLFQNYPNPFNPVTTINYQLTMNNFVTLKVYNTLGEEVATLVNGEKPAGKYQVTFDASKLSSGIYFYRLKAGSFIQTKKMILLK